MILNICNKEEVEKLFFVIATGRSGSNMLIELLNSIDDVQMRMELNTPDNEQVDSDTGIKRVSSFLMSPKYIPKDKLDYTITGCKFLDTHLWMCNLDEEALSQFQCDVKVIHLYRKNILDQFLSLKLARKNNKWISTDKSDGTYKDYNIEVDIEEFKLFEKRTKSKYSQYVDKFPSAYIVDYESLASDPQRVFDGGLFDYLGVPSQIIEFRTSKQNKKTKEYIISNIKDVRSDLLEYL